MQAGCRCGREFLKPLTIEVGGWTSGMDAFAGLNSRPLIDFGFVLESVTRDRLP